MTYEEKETVVEPGDTVLFYSDGLVEAHNREREMFSFPRLEALVAAHAGGTSLVEFLLDKLAQFTGPEWEQEDDICLVTLQRTTEAPGAGPDSAELPLLAAFEWASEPGNERLAMAQVAEAVAPLQLPPDRLERLKTAVAEATMNAMEHGNAFRPEIPVEFEVRASDAAVVVRITDRGGGGPLLEPQVPDLEAKLAGLQTPRGWGLFLIRNMVDEVRETVDGPRHTTELTLHRSGGPHGD
jgi:anti-sigma regulatory factor (Ser/Thr protein kinase)